MAAAREEKPKGLKKNTVALLRNLLAKLCLIPIN